MIYTQCSGPGGLRLAEFLADKSPDQDPFCKANPNGEPKTIAIDDGCGLSFGYVIARKKL